MVCFVFGVFKGVGEGVMEMLCVECMDKGVFVNFDDFVNCINLCLFNK